MLPCIRSEMQNNTQLLYLNDMKLLEKGYYKSTRTWHCITKMLDRTERALSFIPDFVDFQQVAAIH